MKQNNPEEHRKPIINGPSSSGYTRETACMSFGTPWWWAFCLPRDLLGNFYFMNFFRLVFPKVKKSILWHRLVSAFGYLLTTIAIIYLIVSFFDYDYEPHALVGIITAVLYFALVQRLIYFVAYGENKEEWLIEIPKNIPVIKKPKPEMTTAQKKRGNLVGSLYLLAYTIIPATFFLFIFVDKPLFSPKTDMIILMGVAPALTVIMLTIGVWLNSKE